MSIAFLFVILLIYHCVLNAITVNAEHIVSQNKSIDDSVATIMKNYYEDPEFAIESLNAIGVTLINEPKITRIGNSDSNSRALDPTDYELIVYGYSQGTEIYHLQWLLTVKKNESFNRPLDYVSLEWDTAFGSYYLSSGDGAVSTVQERHNGIVLFNVQDYDMRKNDSTYGTVQVKRIKSGEMIFGSKFTHTYHTLVLTGSCSFSFMPSMNLDTDKVGLGLSYTYGYTVYASGSINTWTLWADNGVMIP